MFKFGGAQLACRERRKTRWSVVGAMIGALAMSGSALAAPTCGINYCADAHIKKMYVEAGGALWVETDAPVASLNCTPMGGVYFTLPHAAGSEKIYSLFLTAHTQQSPLSIRLLDNSTGCTVLYVVSEK